MSCVPKSCPAGCGDIVCYGEFSNLILFDNGEKSAALNCNFVTLVQGMDALARAAGLLTYDETVEDVAPEDLADNPPAGAAGVDCSTVEDGDVVYKVLYSDYAAYFSCVGGNVVLTNLFPV